jgi:hypothetical protein
MLVKLTRADVPGDHKCLLQTDYFISVAAKLDGDQVKYTKIRLKTGFTHQVRESVEQVEAIVANALK